MTNETELQEKIVVLGLEQIEKGISTLRSSNALEKAELDALDMLSSTHDRIKIMLYNRDKKATLQEYIGGEL
jgi:hypothetical protein